MAIVLMGELKGHQWQPRDLAALNYAAGWRDPFELTISLMVELAESQGYDHAVNVNPDGTTDRGCWQLNSIHKSITDEIAYDPEKATAAAFSMYKSRGGFEDWAAYNSGVYLHDSYLGRAVMGVANFLGDELLKTPVPDWQDEPYVHKFTTPVVNFQHRLVGTLTHLQRGRKLLGWDAASRTEVGLVQTELAHGETAAKATLPQT